MLSCPRVMGSASFWPRPYLEWRPSFSSYSSPLLGKSGDKLATDHPHPIIIVDAVVERDRNETWEIEWERDIEKREWARILFVVTKTLSYNGRHDKDLTMTLWRIPKCHCVEKNLALFVFAKYEKKTYLGIVTFGWGMSIGEWDRKRDQSERDEK